MNSVKKRIVAATMAALTSATLFATTAFAAGALSKDRNGQTYSYTIGYMYSGNKANTNTREIFSSPNNYDIWCCPVCGRGGGSTGTALEENMYMPCYAYDVAATGGAMNIRYALVRHRHNSGVLSDYKVYIPINEATYSNCYYDYDKTPPSKPTITAPSGWQTKEVTVRFSGATDTGMSLPDSVSTPGNYGSGISHYEYQINGGAWTGCPTNDPTVKITAPGKTTVSARAVDGAGNPSTQIATTTVMIDTVAPNKPTIEAPDGWTNKEVLVTIKDNGDTYSGVKQVEYTLDASGWSLYEKEVGVSEHGIHTVQARVIDQVGHVSETVVKKVQIDKIAPTVEEIEQTVNEGGTQLALTITASDADSGVKGYAVTQSDQTPESDVFGGENQLTVTSNGIYYVWAQDEAGNISQGKELTVTALDRQAPVVTSVETQRTWDAQENWAKITASDENSGVESIGWSSEPDGEIIWESASSSVMVTFQNNGTYYAYARDRAGNISEAVTFEIDRIDKHSPVIDQVEWNRAWSQSKTITVAAHDDESGMGQYAMTRTEERPSEWQTSNVFENITENGTYYLWAKDMFARHALTA